MIQLCLPLGWWHGWGVAGKAITRELAAIAPVQLRGQPFDVKSVGDPLDYELCRSLLPPGIAPSASSPGGIFDGPVLQAAEKIEHNPHRPDVRGSFNVGYTFFELDLRLAAHAAAARRNFDALAAGSTWCARHLRDAGYPPSTVILQGVDQQIFFPMPDARRYFRDRFVIFSGGKFEFRKGQDLVIRAFAAFRQRHRDTLLINAWFNPGDGGAETMSHSPYIRTPPYNPNWPAFARQLLSDNGIDPADSMILGPYANPLIARIYRNSDVGLFPNRCEGGTNLVLCEFMACGRPAIAAWNSGHLDVLTADNSLPIRNHEPITMTDDQGPGARWQDPSLDEAIEQLEWAYQHRDELDRIGRRAAADMSKFTWRKTAEQFHALLTQAAPPPAVVKSTPDSLS